MKVLPHQYHVGTVDRVVYRRHFFEWFLPQDVAQNIKYNPNHLPVIPVYVGYMPASSSQAFPSAYWYICSRELLWSIFEKYGFVHQRSGDC